MHLAAMPSTEFLYRRLLRICRNLASARRDTETISLRFERETLNSLREIAKDKHVSLNSVISQILERYLHLWMYDQSFRFIALSKPLIRSCFAKLSEQDAQEIGKVIGGTVHREIILHLYGKITTRTVLTYLDIFGTRFEAYRHIIEGNEHSINIVHDINVEFSICFGAVVVAMLTLAQIKVSAKDIVMDPNAFTISFVAQT